MTNKRRTIRGLICTLTGAISWGFSGACGQFLTQNAEISPVYITFLRMFFAGLILTLVNISKNKKTAFEVFKTKKTFLRLVLFSVCGLLLSQLTYLLAISYSNAGTATVLQYFGPVLIMLVACVKSRKAPKLSETISLILAFAGVLIIATHGRINSFAISPQGLVWGILAAVSMIFYSMLPASLIDRWGSVGITGWGMLIGGIVMGLFIRPWTYSVPFDVDAVFAILAMIVVGTVFAYTLYMQGVYDIGPVKASMIACVEPVSAVLFSVFWLGTKFVIIDILGFVFVLSTIFILGNNKKSEGKEEI